MKNLKLSDLFYVSLVLLIIAFIISKLIPAAIYYKVALSFSHDGVVKSYIPSFLQQKTAGTIGNLVFLNILFLLIFKVRYIKVPGRSKSKTVSLFDSLRITERGQNINPVYWIIGVFTYFILLSFIMINFNDIGNDEGYYISAIKNYYQSGRFTFPWLDFTELRNQLLFYPFVLLKYLVPFFINLPRYVSFGYTLILLGILYTTVKNKYGQGTFLLFLVLLVSDRSFDYISSHAVVENATLLALFIGILSWTNPEFKYKSLSASFFFALAGLSKLQTLPLIFLTIFILMLLRKEEREQYLKLLIYTIGFWFLGAFLFAAIQGYTFKELLSGFYYLSKSSSQVSNAVPVLNRFSSFNNFFNIFQLVLFVMILFYYLKRFFKSSFLEQILFIFSTINSIWWIFFYASFDPRMLFYAIVINHLLVSIIIVRALKIFDQKKRNALICILLIFLSLNFINSVVFNTIHIAKGISDEYILSLNGYQTPFGDGQDVIKSDQEEFFRQINKNINPGDSIVWNASEYQMFLFAKPGLINSSNSSKSVLNKNSYYLLSYIDWKNRVVNDSVLLYLRLNADLIYQKDYWAIYKIKGKSPRVPGISQ